MAQMERRFYRSIAGLTTLVDSYVLPSGVILNLRELGGGAGASPNTQARIVWDYGGANEVLFATHGDARQTTLTSLEGNGAKVLAIVLDNDLATSDYMGGYWLGST